MSINIEGFDEFHAFECKNPRACSKNNMKRWKSRVVEYSMSYPKITPQLRDSEDFTASAADGQIRERFKDLIPLGVGNPFI